MLLGHRISCLATGLRGFFSLNGFALKTCQKWFSLFDFWFNDRFGKQNTRWLSQSSYVSSDTFNHVRRAVCLFVFCNSSPIRFIVFNGKCMFERNRMNDTNQFCYQKQNIYAQWTNDNGMQMNNDGSSIRCNEQQTGNNMISINSGNQIDSNLLVMCESCTLFAFLWQTNTRTKTKTKKKEF